MSKKYGNPCATYNIPLNSNESDIFRISCAHLYNFIHLNSNHGKSTECKPMMLKMHLELYDSAFMAEAEEEKHMESNDSNKAARQTVSQLDVQNKTLQDGWMDRMEKNIVDKGPEVSSNTVDNGSINALHSSCDNATRQCVQQLEIQNKTLQDALQAKDDFVKKLLERMEKLEKDNDSINALLSSCDNATRQCVQQLEEEIKANKSIDRVEKIEKNNIVNKAPDVDIENKLSGEHNDTENVASADKEQEYLNLRANCVYIQSFKCTDSSLDTAFVNVRKLANEMNAQIPDNSIIHIEVTVHSSNCLDYLVYFRDVDTKNEFLKNRHHYKYDAFIENNLRILDYSNWGIVEFNCGIYRPYNLDTMDELAQKVGMKNIRMHIDHIDVSQLNGYSTICSVRFNNESVKNKFLFNLRHCPETKSLAATDRGGHSLDCVNVNNFSMAIVDDNIIGVAVLMGLSLTTDNFKRLYILNPKLDGFLGESYHISLMVEFSSKHIKNEFLKKSLELEQIQNKNSNFFKDTRSFPIEISDMKIYGNFVSIMYDKSWPNFCTAVSFIGMAKQLGLSLTHYQINRFIALSKLIS